MKQSTQEYTTGSVLGLVFIALIVLGFNIAIETPIREINSTKWIQDGVLEKRVITTENGLAMRTPKDRVRVWPLKLPPEEYQPSRINWEVAQ